MIPLALRLTNFRSFRGTQVFTFPTVPGLYFMQGDNKLEPRLEGNAAGKSTIWDALCWVSFEKTASGLKAGDVCNWDTDKDTVVEFDYMHEGVDCVWTVRRSWKPNTWTLSHVAEFVTDEEVIDLTKAESNSYLADLRLEFPAFLHSVLTTTQRKQAMFLDLKHDQQAALFSEVLGADRWLDYSAGASKKASAQDAVSRGLERDLSNLRGRLEAIDGHDFAQAAGEWELKRKGRLNAISEQHDDLVAHGKRLKADLAAAEEDETNRRALVAKSQPDAGLVKDHGRARSDVIDYGNMLATEREKYRALHAHLEALENNAVCPTCKQAMSGTSRITELRRGEAELRKVNEAVSKLQKEHSAAVRWEESTGAELDKQDRALAEAQASLQDAVRKTSQCRRAYDLNERELDALEDRSLGITEEANPFAIMADRAREDGARLRDDIADAQDRLDDSNERHSRLSYWVRGFKEVRLMQIAEALTELEVEVNSCVTALGLVDWELNFHVDRETKGGNIQRGFNTLVRSPSNDRAVPWEAWSGGEAQRLRVAATMGLANLIRSRTGAGLALEVWDEPTQGLSPQGVSDLLEALAARARNEGRVIWLVDHRAHDFGGFAGGALITKGASGSAISQY